MNQGIFQTLFGLAHGAPMAVDMGTVTDAESESQQGGGMQMGLFCTVWFSMQTTAKMLLH
jgi:hypothetical protein